MALSLNGTSTGSLNNLSLPNETGTLTSSPSTTKVGFRVANDTVTIVDAATDYTIPYANDSGFTISSGTRFDLGNNFNTSTYKFVVPVTGYYMMTNTTFTTSASDSARYIRLRLHNQTQQIHEVLTTNSDESGNNDYNQIVISGVFLLTAADELYCTIASSVGSSQISVNAGTSVWSCWLLG